MFLKNNFLQCPIDKTYILEGLEGIDIKLNKEKKVVGKIVEKKKWKRKEEKEEKIMNQ